MRTVLIAVSMAGAAVAPAAAQSPHATITAPADQPYAMRHSKLTVPPVLDGMRRTAIRQLGDGEVDVYAVYENAADAITVYAYRNVVGSVPVWFDRARAAIEERVNVYGTVTAAGPPARVHAARTGRRQQPCRRIDDHKTAISRNSAGAAAHERLAGEGPL